MDEQGLSATLKRLMCPRCRKRYDVADLLFIGAGGGGKELNLRCLRCRLRIRLTVPLGKRRRDPARQSRSSAKASRERRREPVSEADVLHMQRFLAGFDGSVEELLRQIN